MPTSIILIRHGETAWNAERRLQGHLDIGLNEEGLRQADAVAAALADERIDYIYASDLRRAHLTAQAIAAHHAMPVQQTAGLRERCYGVFEGMLYSDIARQYPLQFAAWQARDIDARMPDGANPAESFSQFYQRAIGTIHACAAAHRGRTVVIVAHGGVLECAYRAALALPLETPRHFHIHNASINRFVLDGGALSLLHWGDVAHLEQAALDELS